MAASLNFLLGDWVSGESGRVGAETILESFPSKFLFFYVCFCRSSTVMQEKGFRYPN